MSFVGIRSEGGLLPLDILEDIAQAKAELGGQQPKDFGLPAGRRLTDEIARAWNDAQDYWHIFQRRRAALPEGDSGTTITREKWAGPLLGDLLGFSELTLQPSGVVVAGRNYPISHRGGVGEEAPPVDIEGCNLDLDRRPETRRLSPQALVQEYLNNSEDHLWGAVTNGLRLRLLRDTSRTSRPSYVEFDLEGILEGNRFNEFALFYRLCHRSRLPRTAEDSTTCWLEKYFQASIERGGRVRDKLRDGVEESLKLLGTGLLRHPKNEALRERIASNQLTPPQLHRQLLRLVYRLLFLMVAEERRMIVPEAPDSEKRQRLYDQLYSVARLRNLCERHIEKSTFGDQWLGLQQTFGLFEDGANPNILGIPPLNGDLFSTIAMPDLRETRLYNDDLLRAMRHLSLFVDKGVRQRINYRDLDVEELGSVYESLLDYQPVFDKDERGPKFDLRVGSERKSTGSYYTRPELVRELIESALVPVMDDRLKQVKEKDAAKAKAAKQQAILSMTVCDPACGSGHFLLAAARRLGRELSKIKSGEEEPTPREFHLAVRDVITHCIYGVDLNPLAVDLCKLALWLEGHWTGKPLSFLDHRIKCGNSLIGVLDTKVLEEGVPDDAYTAVAGDVKSVASSYKRENKEARKRLERSRDQGRLRFHLTEDLRRLAEEARQLSDLAEETPSDVREKAKRYAKLHDTGDFNQELLACHLWTAAFFAEMKQAGDVSVPTTADLERCLEGLPVNGNTLSSGFDLAKKFRFFHWRLEFPEVFERGGFDVMLGNPPWDAIQPEEVKFFNAENATEIAALPGARRKAAIEALKKDNPALSRRWHEYQRKIELECKFLRACGRFSLVTSGKLNTYSLFAGLVCQVIPANGCVGVIVQSGIATDDACKEFFSHLVESGRLVSLFDFVNLEGFFPGIHRTHPHFCALTVSGRRHTGMTEFAFYMTRTDQLADRRRHFNLSATEFALLNPNSHTCPVFRSGADAELTKKVYRTSSVLIGDRGSNPWTLTLRQGLFNSTADSGLFSTKSGAEQVPLYEAKYFHQFDHRYATWERDDVRECASAEKADPSFVITPRYWVTQSEVDARVPEEWRHSWALTYRRITNATNERTMIAAIVPLYGFSDVAPLCFSPEPPDRLLCLLANFNSLVFDYVARQKIGGTHMDFHQLKQTPIIGPTQYQPDEATTISQTAAKLSFTADDLCLLAKDLGIAEVPVEWNDEQRRLWKAELDAYYAHLYGLTRDELRYILDPKDVFGDDFPSETFRVLKEREEKEFGEYRTRRLVLEAFDRLAESPRFRDEMAKRESAFKVPTKRASAEVTSR